MSLVASLLAKYLPTAIKVGLAYYDVHHKEAFDLPLKAAENDFKERLAAFEKKGVAKAIRADIVAQLEPLVSREADAATFETAAAIAATTLETLDPFPFLFEHLFDPQRVKNDYRRALAKPLALKDSGLDEKGLAVRRALGTALPSEHSPEGALHDRILDATAQAYVARIHDLPGFQRWFVREVRRRFAANDDRFIPLERALGESFANDLRFDLHYRTKLLGEIDRVELFIRHDEIDREENVLSLDIAYVTLELAGGRERDDASVTVRGEELLTGEPGKSKRVLVLGKAGSGKTTLLRWFALKATQIEAGRKVDREGAERPWGAEAARSSAPLWQDQAPFFIRLRDLPKGRFPTPDEFATLVQLDRKAPPNWGERLMDRGGALLLIDGLDELSPSRRNEALAWIEGLRKTYRGENTFVVSSRPEAVDPGALKGAGFVEYAIRDLTADGKVQFIRNWHRAAVERLKDAPMLVRRLPEKEAALLEEVRRNPSVSALAATPLLCALLCALNRVNSGRLPDNLRELCRSAVQMMMRDRDEEQEGLKELAPEEYRALSLDFRIEIARTLAYEMLERAAGTMTRPEAISFVRVALGGGAPAGKERAKRVFEGLHFRSNLVRDCGRNGIEFAHNDLRDYLASGRYADDDLVEPLVRGVRSADRAKWQPVLLFATGDPKERKFRNEIVRALLTPEDGVAAPSDEDVVLAMRVADQTEVPLDAELSADLKGLRARFTPLNTVAKVRKLAAAGPSALPYLRLRGGRPAGIDVACVRALLGLKTEEASAAILDYFTDDAPEPVLEAVAEAIGYEAFAKRRNVLELPSVRDAVQWFSLERRPFDAYVADLSPLAGLASLGTLSLAGTAVADLSPLAGLASLGTLSLAGTAVADLSPLAGLASLGTLSLAGTAVADLSPLAGLASLGTLSLGNTAVADLSPLAGLASLERLWLDGTAVADLSPLAGLASLGTLSLNGTAVADLSPLAGLASLEWLSLAGTAVADLSPLAGLASLEWLSLAGTAVADLSPLAGLASLEWLSLAGTAVADLSPLAGLASLGTLSLGNTAVADLSPLAGLASLEWLSLDGTAVTSEQVVRLKKALPNLTVLGK